MISSNPLGVFRRPSGASEQRGGSSGDAGGVHHGLGSATGASRGTEGALGGAPGGTPGIVQSPLRESRKRLINKGDGADSQDGREVARDPVGGQVADGDNCSKVASIFSSFQSDEDIMELISLYRIPPSVLCRHAEAGESACCNSPDEIVFYEGILEAGLRFPIPGPICRVLEHFSLVPGKLAPNGWRVLLAFFALWQLTHGASVPPPFEEFLATYTLLENPVPHRGWYRFSPRSGKFISGLTSNLHKWKKKFFFVRGEWASESDRCRVPTQWDIVPTTKQASPTLNDEQKRLLEMVRNNPAREHFEIMSAAGISMAPSKLKKKGPPIDRSIVWEVFSSKVASSSPSPSKRAKSSAPSSSQLGSTGLLEAELGDTPPPSLTDVPLPPRDGPSTIVGVGTPTLGRPSLGDASTSMLRDVRLARERFCDFMTGVEAQEIVSRGPEGMINAAVEGFALVAAALPSLFNNTLWFKDVINSLARERQAREVAEEQLGLERQVREDAVKLERLERQAREDAAEELKQARVKVAQLEADLCVALERATRAEAQRDAVERVRASAFIDGYEELRRKASVAFPHCDLSDLKPDEAPESDDEGDYVSGGSESQ